MDHTDIAVAALGIFERPVSLPPEVTVNAEDLLPTPPAHHKAVAELAECAVLAAAGEKPLLDGLIAIVRDAPQDQVPALIKSIIDDYAAALKQRGYKAYPQRKCDLRAILDAAHHDWAFMVDGGEGLQRAAKAARLVVKKRAPEHKPGPKGKAPVKQNLADCLALFKLVAEREGRPEIVADLDVLGAKHHIFR